MDTPMQISITYGTIVKTILTLLGLYALYMLSDLVLVVITAIVIASATEPGSRWFMKYGIPRLYSVIAVYVAFIGVFVSIGYFFVPSVLNEFSHMVASLSSPTAAEAVTFEAPFFGTVSLSEIAIQIREVFKVVSESPFEALSAIFGGITSFILVIVFSFYFAVQERGIEDFLRIVTPLRYETYIVGLWNRTKDKIGLWMQGQFILGLVIGVLTFLCLSLLQVPYPALQYTLALAVIAGLFEIIPLFGPTLSAIPAIAFGFIAGGFPLALIIVVLYFIIQQFENHLIYPLVVTKVVGVPPVMVILALVIGLKLAGFFGVLLAVPMAALVQEIISDWDKGRQLGNIRPTSNA
jgi:predicted PurR-regulated permease PerM